MREDYSGHPLLLLDPLSTPSRHLALAELLEGKTNLVRGGLSGASECLGRRIKLPQRGLSFWNP